MPKQDSIVVTVDDAALKNIQAVASKLSQKGMTVDQVLPVTGVITGSCPPGKRAELSAVRGVHSVETESTVQLPPPDADVQ